MLLNTSANKKKKAKYACKAFTTLLLLLVILLLITIIFVPGCRPRYQSISLKPKDDTDLATAPTPHYKPQSEHSFSEDTLPLRLAIAPVLSPPRTRESYQGLILYLSDKLGQPVELIIRSTYAEINQLIKHNQVDVALVCAWTYVEQKENGSISLLAVPQINGKTQNNSLLIVNKKSGAGSLADLRHHSFVFTDPLSFTGRLYTLYLLAQMDENPDTFFADVFYSYSNDNSIIAVAEGWVDAAAVDSHVYEFIAAESGYDLEDKVLVIDTSPPVGNPPLVISNKVPEELHQKLKEIFLNMHSDEEGKKVLAKMKVNRFVEGDNQDYQFVRQVMKAMEGRF
ncbi:MAG: phosphate/phosphite/phosphonate ABC transporter substrate-binding protein [Firmicutes bacterium]|nr:phosphate/phosphite/phosphonate ABC transporter substrate-binding protein [Bacillota bacterium]